MDRRPAGRRRRSDAARRPGDPRRVLVVAVVAVVAGALLPIGASLPRRLAAFGSPRRSTHVVGVDRDEPLRRSRTRIKNVVSQYLLDPLQSVLTTSPWWLVIGVAVGVAFIVSGRGRRSSPASRCLARRGARRSGSTRWRRSPWSSWPSTITMIIGVALGVSSARSDRFAQILRPINDAAQTMPSFVYLLPAVALFGPTRFTAHPRRGHLCHPGGDPAGRGRRPGVSRRPSRRPPPPGPAEPR